MRVQGPGTNEFKHSYWSKALNQSQGLYARVQDQKVANWGSTYMAPVLEGKSIVLDHKTVLKGELLISRTKNKTRDQGTVQIKESICFRLGIWTLDPHLKWALVTSKYTKTSFWVHDDIQRIQRSEKCMVGKIHNM
jgi:hypothetical protein